MTLIFLGTALKTQERNYGWAPELQEEKNAQSTMLSPVFYWGGRGPDIRISCWFFVSRVVIKGVVAVIALVWPGVVRFKTGQDFADVFDLLKLITDFLLHLDKGERKWWNAQSSIKWAPYALIQHQWQVYMPLSQYRKQVAKCTPALKWQSHIHLFALITYNNSTYISLHAILPSNWPKKGIKIHMKA